MHILDIDSMQKEFLKQAPLGAVLKAGKNQGPEETFKNIKDVVKKLYDQNPKISRFVIAKKVSTQEEVPYCLTMTPNQIEYKEGSKESSKTIVCKIEECVIELNRQPTSSDFNQTFLKYLSKVFQDLNEKKALLFEESKSE